MLQDDTTRLLTDSVKGFLQALEAKGKLRIASRSAEDEDTITSEIVDLGWPGLCLPESLSGLGLGLDHAAVFSELFGEKAFTHWLIDGAFVPSLLLGSCSETPQMRRLAEDIVTGAPRCAFAWQERAGQIDGELPAVTLERKKLSGTKVFVPVTNETTDFIIYATQAGAPVIVVLPADQPGLNKTVEHLSDGSSVASLSFAQTSVEEAWIIARGDNAVGAARGAIAAATILKAGQLYGVARGALNQTIAYLHSRSQFGQKLSSLQVLQHRAVDLHTQVRLAEASWRNALAKHSADPLSPPSLAAISAAKARTSDVALLVSKSAIQMHGAIGFTDDADIGRYLKAALAWSSSLGNAAQHRLRFSELTSDDL